jgi:parvulin-like peptidyl-prolyl isomerase
MKLPSLLALALVLAALPAVRAAVAVNGIAALVGDSVITEEDVQVEIFRTVQLFQSQFGNQPEVLTQRVREARRQGVERLVDRALILEDFAGQNFNLPEQVIEDNVQEEIKQRFGDRLTLIKTLQERGKTYEAFRQEIKDQFIEAVMRNRNVPRDILISPARLEEYYRTNSAKFSLQDQVKLRMIVLEKARHQTDVQKLAREILAKLDEGADFAEMAAIYSDGSQAREGGSWGWVEKSVLREDLAEVAFSLRPGQRSSLIEKDQAIYIMLVEEARPAHVRPLPEVREEIERTLQLDERTRLQQAWLDRLRRKSFVRYF